MPTEDNSTSPSGLEVNKLLRELEVPLAPDSAASSSVGRKMALTLRKLRYASCVTEVEAENPFDRRDEQESE